MDIKEDFARCQRCKRKLTNPKHKALGFGPACYKKHLAENRKTSKRLF